MQLVDPEDIPAMERLTQEVLLLREKVASVESQGQDISGNRRQQVSYQNTYLFFYRSIKKGKTCQAQLLMKESANMILYCVCSLLSSLPLFSHSFPSFLPFSQSFLSASCVWFPSPLSYCSHVWILPFRVLKLKTYSAYDIDSHTVIYYGKLRQVIRSLAF